MAEPTNDREPSVADSRAEIEANRLALQREERRGARIFIALVAMLMVLIAILGWTQP